jgi:hypothetical protein
MYGYGYQYGGISGGGLPFTPPLDVYTGAAAAYSISRILRSDYTGNAFKVRRTSDNATLDVGFVNGYTDMASLLTFAGVNTCVITDIYDQVGSNNWVQTTAAMQPTIINAGSLQYLSGTALRPCLRGDGVDDNMDATTEVTLSQYLIVTAFDFTSYAKLLYGGKTSPAFMGTKINLATNTIQFRDDANGVKNGTAITVNTSTPYVHSMQQDAGSNSFKSYVDGTEDTLTSSTNGTFKLGKLLTGFTNSTAFEWAGAFCEMLVWNTANATDRAAIEANLLSFYKP